MTDKPVLFLDNDFLTNTYGRSQGDTDRFNRIMDSYYEQYDVRITDRVFAEATNGGQPSYDKDVAVNNWLDSKGIQETATTTPSGTSDAGEKSIVDAIKADPALYDGGTQTPRSGTFVIGSNDTSFFGSGQEGADFAPHTQNAQTMAKDGTVFGSISAEDYKSLSTTGSPTAGGGWEDYKQVTIDAAENRFGVNGNLDTEGNFVFEKDGKSITIGEGDLFRPADYSTTSVFYDDGFGGAAHELTNLGKFGSALDKAGFIGDLLGTAVAVAQAQYAYAHGDYEGAGSIIAGQAGNLAGGFAVGTASAALITGLLLTPGVNVGVVAGMALVGAAGLLGGYVGGTSGEALLKDLYKDISDLGVVPFIEGLADDYGWAFNNPGALLGELLPDGLPSWIPSWLVPVGGVQGGAGQVGFFALGGGAGGIGCPLILDLDGDGVEVTKLDQGAAGSHVYFDMDNDGFAERTAWTTGGDGLLALDVNGNGVIDDKSELFGNSDTFSNGFAALGALDSNADGAITSADAQFADLRVWIDADGDGVTDAGELRTLGDLGITRIDLNATALSDVYNNENFVSHRATFTINGQTRTVDDVWLRTDEADTRWTGDVDLDVRTLFLPTLKGFGTLTDLHVAMSLDESLLTLVQNFAGAWDTARFVDYNGVLNDVRAILYKWAGVEGMDPNDPRAPGVDARSIAFLEKLTGVSNAYIAALPPGESLSGVIPDVIANSFDVVLYKLSAALILQSGGEAIFDGVSYNPTSGDFTSGAVDHTEITSLIAQANALNNGQGTPFWNGVTNFLVTVNPLESFSADDLAVLDAAGSLNGVYDWFSYATLVARTVLQPYYLIGTEFSDLLIGGDGADFLQGAGGDDIVSGLGGNDRIFGSDGNDTLSGGFGNDEIAGGPGNDIVDGGEGDDAFTDAPGDDTYIYNPGDGHDVIWEYSGTDVIRFGEGIAASSISFDRINDQDLRILIDGTAAIDVQYFFSGDGYRIERLEFADGPSMDLSIYTDVVGTDGDDTLNGLDRALLKADHVIGGNGNDTINGGSGNDWLEGGYGNDTLGGGSGDDKIYGNDGDDTLRGHAGNDLLSGGYGSDTYNYSSGDGLDTIADNGAAGDVDTIRFGTGFAAADMSLVRVGYYDMAIEFAGDRKILIQNQFLDSGAIETVRFADGTVVDLTTWTHRVNGTAAGETIYGTDAGAGPDKLYGYGGNDTIYAYRGDDYLIGGEGDDYLDGGLGDDRYTYESGVDTIIDNGGNDRIDLGAGITLADLSWARSGTSGLDLSINGVLAVHMGAQFSSQDSGIERIRFNDGSSFYLSALQFTTNGTAGNDTLYGISWGANPDDTLNGLGGDDTLYGWKGNDVINGGAGNDTLWGGEGNDVLDGGAGNDRLYGDDGDDTFKINAEEGVDTIFDSTGNDKIVFGAGLSSANMTMVRDAVNTNDLDISFGGVLTAVVQGHFNTWGSGALETLQFSDGSTVNVLNTSFTQTGTSGNDYLYGYAGKDRLLGNGGNDALYGYDGNDRLEGGSGDDYLAGGTGNDTYIYTTGADIVYEALSEGTDTVSVSFTPTQVRSWADSSGYFYIQSASSPADVLKLSGSMNYTAGNYGFDVGQRVESVSFSDGTVWNLTTGLLMDDTDDAHSLYGSAQADTMDGNGGNDSLYGYDGADLLYGGNGTDWLHGGEGDDRLYGENGDDYLFGDAGKDWVRGGAGNDVIYGGDGDDGLVGDAGVDTLYGEAGADRFIFYPDTTFDAVDTIMDFSVAEGDRIDVGDLLIGFDPLTKLITDFVQIADNGGSSIVSVDRDGTGGAYGMAQIATLQAVTGLTDEQALLNNGTIIAV